YLRIRHSTDPGIATVFDAAEHGAPQGGDIPKSSVEYKTVMLVSHGCELDRVLVRGEPPERRHWLAAPVHPLSAAREQTQQRTREGGQPNRFYLRPSRYTGEHELCVDLRKITPINCQYFIEAAETSRRVCSLTEQARAALFSHLGVFFSGRALYLQPIPCPHCGNEVDSSQFQVSSGDEPDID
ncbi:MAG TPA: hypothetical protein VKU44_11555, partial [Terriglobia bacterium]|nr:hypothetical protein [Terriglobia bacterium]